jgi:hypothetical protein
VSPAFQTIRTSGPAGTPVIPPVSELLDMAGAKISLDADAIELGWLPNPNCRIAWDHDPCDRVRIVGIGDYLWLLAEEKAAHDFGDDRVDAWGKVHKRGIDLTKCLFGGFYFERFQSRVMTHYLMSIGLIEKKYAYSEGRLMLTEATPESEIARLGGVA